MKLKKFTAVLIALILLLCSIPFSASAASAASTSSDTAVAKMYICSRTKRTGHVWLYFENLTNKTITVGCYKLPKNQGVTVSAYNVARKDGKGNYYNIDGYCLNKYGSSSTTSGCMTITASQLKTVSEKILSRNTWSGSKNCCYFAATVWNSVATTKLKVLLVPSLMSTEIKKVKCSTPKFYNPTKDQCFKQVGTGENATLKQCSSGSYNRLVG